MVVEEHLVTGELPVPFASKGFKRAHLRANLRREGHVDLADGASWSPLNRDGRPRPRTSSGDGTCPARRLEEVGGYDHERAACNAGDTLSTTTQRTTHPIVGVHIAAFHAGTSGLRTMSSATGNIVFGCSGSM